jgi:deoxyribodipyrimidine photo-lyase
VTWISELIWREFYRHVLVGYPRVCKGRAFRPETEDVRWRNDETGFRAWCEGRTGFPVVDAAMRQLARTGWMHNRLRMIAASFLVKDLLVDWRRGESWFMEHLVDGDFASNNGGWQWAASTGTDAQPYIRVFNPTTQSRRFDPDGEFLRRFLPELADLPAPAVHDPTPEQRRARDYPSPLVDHAAARLRAIRAFESLK